MKKTDLQNTTDVWETVKCAPPLFILYRLLPLHPWTRPHAVFTVSYDFILWSIDSLKKKVLMYLVGRAHFDKIFW